MYEGCKYCDADGRMVSFKPEWDGETAILAVLHDLMEQPAPQGGVRIRALATLGREQDDSGVAIALIRGPDSVNVVGIESMRGHYLFHDSDVDQFAVEVSALIRRRHGGVAFASLSLLAFDLFSLLGRGFEQWLEWRQRTHVAVERYAAYICREAEAGSRARRVLPSFVLDALLRGGCRDEEEDDDLRERMERAMECIQAFRDANKRSALLDAGVICSSPPRKQAKENASPNPTRAKGVTQESLSGRAAKRLKLREIQKSPDSSSLDSEYGDAFVLSQSDAMEFAAESEIFDFIWENTQDQTRLAQYGSRADAEWVLARDPRMLTQAIQAALDDLPRVEGE